MLTTRNLFIAGVLLLLVVGAGLLYLNHGNQAAKTAVDPSTQVGMVPPAGGPPAPVTPPPAETTPPPAAGDDTTTTPPPASKEEATKPAPKSVDEEPAPTPKEEAAAKADAASPRYIAQVRADLTVEDLQNAKHVKRFAFLMRRAGLQPTEAKAEEWLKALTVGETSTIMPTPSVGKFFWGDRCGSDEVFTMMDIGKIDAEHLTGVVYYLDDDGATTDASDRFVSFQLGKDGGHYMFVGQSVAGKSDAQIVDIASKMTEALNDPSDELVAALDSAVRKTAWAQSVEERLTKLGQPAPAQ